MEPTILVVDDNPDFRRFIRGLLGSHRYAVDEVPSGEAALEVLQHRHYDVVLLDLHMPGMGGLEACRAICAKWDVPVMVISGDTLEIAQIRALDAGSIDYITKPFSVNEFLARIRAALRRAPLAESGLHTVRAGHLEMDFVERRIIVSGKEVHLTRKEFDLLQCLVSNANTTVSHRTLLSEVWGREAASRIAYLRTFINQLRKKIELNPGKPEYIVAEKNTGYIFRLPNAE